MSTAQSPQPEETAPPPDAGGAPGSEGAPAIPGPTRPPGAPDGTPARPRAQSPDRAEWTRRLLTGLTVGLVVWGVAALLSPGAGALRQLAAAALCATAAVAVPLLLARDRGPDEQTLRTQSALAETAATVRDGLERHDDDLRAALERHDDHLRTGLARHSEDIRQLVENRLAQQAPPPETYPPLDRVRTEGVPELAKRFAEALSPGPSILYTFVRLEMQRVLGHMAALTSMSVECHGENHDWMLTLTHAAERSVDAISTSVDREFWNSEPASRYLDAQREAIEEHGVPVRRLFLLASARELDDRLLRLCDEQQALHIEVRVAVLPELPPHLQRGTTDDFIVYDEEVSFEIEQDLRDVNVRTRLIARRDHVQDRMKRFRELWEAGMSIRELEVRVDDEEDGTWMVDRA
ncbi:proline-rich domain-containing protein [Streptomyces sp. XY152]|uniref:proline-rich domain-containing protein n=1 Tax=Streptomyces sp. XY152 TaxID=1415560 RepID=UPI0006C43705|nr:proline-rich domain-containing protein [Streptomyces sp. XY152]KOV32079.1 membrane protein [Streptomyces sp. XY152]